MSPIERGERFQSGQYSTLSSLAAGVCREFDRLTDAVNSVEKNVKSVEKAAGASAISMPTAPTLSDGTLTPPPATWGYVQHLDKGDDYWLRKNIPQYSSGGSNNTGAIITARLYHGAAGKYDFLLLEQSLTIAAFVAVYEYDPNTKTYSSTPFYVPFLEAVTQIDSTNGYSDIDIAHPRITVNDHISIPIVAVFGQGGSAQTVYGDTEKGFVAGNGTSEPESPTLACTHKDIFYDDYTATFTRGYSTADPPSATSCNFYETLEIWIQNLATDTVPRCSSTDPDDCDAAEPPARHTELCWYLEKEKDLKPRVKRLKNHSETGNWKVKFRIQHPEHRHPRVAVRVLDKFGQLGEYNNHANDDESEGVKITALNSYKDDDGATQKIEYAVKLTVTKDSGAADPNTIRIKAQPYGTTKKFIQDFDYESDADTYTLDKHFKKGKQVRLYVKALYSGGLKSTNWIECLTSVTGYTSGYYTVGGSAPTLTSEIVISAKAREGKTSVVEVAIPSSGDAANIGAIQIWACAYADRINPATPPVSPWKKVSQMDIQAEDLGKTIEVSINRPNAWKKCLAARAISQEDNTVKGPWHDYGGGVRYFTDEHDVTMTFTGVRDNNTNAFDTITITLGADYPYLAKVKARKRQNTNASWKLLPVIDAIDPDTGFCEDLTFDIDVPHKPIPPAVHPIVEVQLVDVDGNKTAWQSWDGGGNNDIPAPTLNVTSMSSVNVTAATGYGTPISFRVYASSVATADPTNLATMGTELTADANGYSVGTLGATTTLTILKINTPSGLKAPSGESYKLAIACTYTGPVYSLYAAGQFVGGGTSTYTVTGLTVVYEPDAGPGFNCQTSFNYTGTAPTIVGFLYKKASTYSLPDKPTGTNAWTAYAPSGWTKLTASGVTSPQSKIIPSLGGDVDIIVLAICGHDANGVWSDFYPVQYTPGGGGVQAIPIASNILGIVTGKTRSCKAVYSNPEGYEYKTEIKAYNSSGTYISTYTTGYSAGTEGSAYVQVSTLTYQATAVQIDNDGIRGDISEMFVVDFSGI